MARESFVHRETEQLFQQLEEVSQRSSISRGQAFEDLLHVVVCALGHPLMEEEYLQTVERHKAGPSGKRGIDKLAEMFANLVAVTEQTRSDILGDLFQGGITYGERGQFMTPDSISDMMAAMSLPAEKTGLDGRRTVHDPCCGSGRMLLSAAKLQPNWHFVGQDVDLRCVRMTAINLAMRNLYGHVVCGNSLSNTCSLIYETGRLQLWGNVIRKVGRIPLPQRQPEVIDIEAPPEAPAALRMSEPNDPRNDDDRPGPTKQLNLF